MKVGKVSKWRMFTFVDLIGLMAIVIVVAVIVFAVCLFTMMNCWYTEAGVMQRLKANDTSVVELLNAQRNIFSKSVITVKMTDGSRRSYLLDTDILFNYNFKAQ